MFSYNIHHALSQRCFYKCSTICAVFPVPVLEPIPYTRYPVPAQFLSTSSVKTLSTKLKSHSGEKFFRGSTKLIPLHTVEKSTKLIPLLVFLLRSSLHHSSHHLPPWNDAGAGAQERRKAKRGTKMLPSLA